MLFLMILLTVASCSAKLDKTTPEEFKKSIQGRAQGTTWQVVYYDLQERDFTHEVDSILKRIDKSVSTYDSTSVISKWNNSTGGAVVDSLFLDLLYQSWQVYTITSGAFDPTVKPLVNYWGFGSEQFEQPDHVDGERINALMTLVGFDTLTMVADGDTMSIESAFKRKEKPNEALLIKPIPGMKIDFNAIGQGWSVDGVVDHLQRKEIKVFFVEIGGELVAGKAKPDGSLWKFGIDKPSDKNLERNLQAIIQLREHGLATSGNYRKFYVKDGIRYSHTIDPNTGYPVDHSLLSATVVSSTAARADAMATAFMVMGTDSTISFLEHNDYLDDYVYLISASGDTFRTYVSETIQSQIDVVE